MSSTSLTFLLCGVIVKTGSATARESGRERSKYMYEIFAIAAGAVIGLASQKTASTHLKVAVVVLGSVIVGAIASIISGELLISSAYLVFDALQVLLASCATAVLVTAWRRRATRVR